MFTGSLVNADAALEPLSTKARIHFALQAQEQNISFNFSTNWMDLNTTLKSYSEATKTLIAIHFLVDLAEGATCKNIRFIKSMLERYMNESRSFLFNAPQKRQTQYLAQTNARRRAVEMAVSPDYLLYLPPHAMIAMQNQPQKSTYSRNDQLDL